MLAIVRNGTPSLLQDGADVTFTLTIDGASDDYTASWASVPLWSDAERVARGIYNVVEVDATPGPTEKLGPAVLAFADGQVTATRSAVAMSGDEIAARKAALRAYAAGCRWNKEQGGIAVGGVSIATDDASQRKIAELRRRVAAQEVAVPFGFKAQSGWVDVDEPTIIAIDQAVAAHVAACYALEREVDADIDAGTLTTEAAVAAAFA